MLRFDFAFALLGAFVVWTEVSATDTDDRFEREVVPVLRRYCFKCHGPDRVEARIRLDSLSSNLAEDRAAAEYWQEVRNVLHAAEMPPADEPQLSKQDREQVLGWIDNAIAAAIDSRRNTSGRVVLRRLNRYEYQNTMRDLLGLDMDYARDLPPDPASADGFRNDGNSLQMSSLQLEYYLKTARTALDRIIVSGEAPRVYEYTFEKSNVNNWLQGTERSNRLQRKQAFLGTMPKEYPEQGEFLVRVHMTAELKPEAGYPLLEVSVGYRPDTQILFHPAGSVEITSEEEQVHEFRGRLENHPLPVRGQGKFPGLVVMVRNAFDDGSPPPQATGDKKRQDQFEDEPELSIIHVKKVEFKAPAYDRWPPALQRQILFDSELRAIDEAAYVNEVLARFMERAFRRRVTFEEVTEMTRFFEAVRPEFPSFEEAVRETLAMVLIRPEFLYLVEPSSGHEKRPIGDWELASRLSYFLWSTSPDAELLEAARIGDLKVRDRLRDEVKRLLGDPRSFRFVEQFTRQWLHLENVDRVAVNPDYYPKFDARLKSDMQRETEHFFGELLAKNASALNLLSSDFSMLNERLARHYGIDGVRGERFRRVSLPPELHRGGLLGHASILLSNSTGADSHAVRRAVFIRDRLLNDPPAPPPPDVPSLEEADPEFLQLSVRDQLEIHREREACASCHRSIDPWGIALENFDAVGLWRNEVRRKVDNKFRTQPVEATDSLPDGHVLAGADALRQVLVQERQEEFARALVVRLLTYAIGRPLELTDQAAVDALTRDFIRSGYGLRDLVVSVATSEPFLTK